MIPRTNLRSLACCSIALLFAAASVICAAEPALPDQALAFTAKVRPLLEKYCGDCHGADKQEGGINFSPVTSDVEAQRRRSLWKRSVRRVQAGEMPPEDATPLPVADRTLLVEWLQFASEYVDCSDPARFDPGSALFRRMTRTEFNNTIRDLLSFNFDAASAAGIGEDGGGEGFENLAAALTLSPSLMEKYFTAADKIVDAVAAQDGNGERARRALFFVPPDEKLAPRDAAEQIVTRLARRAYRRLPSEEDIARLMHFYDQATAKGVPFEAAIQTVLKPVLISPRFLFRIEEDRPAPTGAVSAPINDDELAVRLSYFLWASMPDDELFRVAADHTLSDPAVLESQVRRMLSDNKARTLTDIFFAQWLQIRKLDRARPSTDFFPTFTGQLKNAMREEILTFCDRLRVEDRSVLDLLDADYTYVNELLSGHYGLTGVQGQEFRQVSLPADQHRGGLLGMAGVLSLTSHTFRTSPTQRGKYVLEVIFGTPPPPPPANAGTLKDDQPGAAGQARTFREQLAQHATQASCAGCHRKIDPLGFSLENYNAIGIWRESTPEVPIDSSGVLPSGQAIAGAAGLKQVVLERRDEFARNTIEQLLKYALGRELDDADECSLRAAHEQLKAGDYKFSVLVELIVQSVPFRLRRAEQSSP